ncbi:hypothetical protein ACL07V_18475 [Streptomyces sp. MB22_4]|uniref:hypothetical protein n=1 Tax=Streptomyces sp. MB22_4 TaxID=3383120 RepID=UPI0039A083AE
MGDHFQTIVDLDATAADAPRLARRVLGVLVAEGVVLPEGTDRPFGGHLPGPHWHKAVGPGETGWAPTDGLTVYTGRTVFHGGQGDAEWVRCPRCAATTPLLTDEYDRIDAAWEPYGRAVSRWQETGEAAVTCPGCAAAVPLAEWTWADDYFAFGCLGLEFWNWPEFGEAFRGLVADALDGHRTTLVWGKF